MDEHTAEGAEQAFKYYIATLYWGYQTGSSETLKTLQGPTCTVCNDFTSTIADIDDNGTFWKDVSLSDKGSTTSESENYDFEVGYIFIVSEHLEPTIDVETPSATPEQPYTARGGMNWTGTEWSVGGIDIAETERDL